MSTTQIPPRRPAPPPPPPKPGGSELYDPGHWETAYRNAQVFDAPRLLIQMQDDLSRSRRREALWLSIIVHIFGGLVFWSTPYFLQFLPHRHTLSSTCLLYTSDAADE